MKKIIFYILTIALSSSLGSCGDDDWQDGDPALADVYFVGFEDWGNFTNNVTYTVKKGTTVAIPVQFHSEQVRSFDITTYYYVNGELSRGTDYEIVDENGTVLSADSNGAFSLTWPQAKKGIKNVYVKALNNHTGSFNVLTHNPASGDISHPDNITNSMTGDYEVRSFSQNYKVTVQIED